MWLGPSDPYNDLFSSPLAQHFPETKAMKSTLEVGLQSETTFVVTEDMAPPHLPAKVLSTPSMIGQIEGACLHLAQAHLDANETTVGTHVNISHTGPAMAGEEVRVEARLSEINKRRLTFEVSVHSPRGAISEGSHQRAVVDTSRFG